MVPLKASGQNPSVPLQVQVDHFNLCLRGHVAFSLCLCVFSSDSPKGLTETLAIGFKAQIPQNYLISESLTHICRPCLR